MANASLADLRLFYSGGGSNSDTTLSIGGAISSTRVTSQSASFSGALASAITINDAMGNAEGAGTLTYTASTGKATWQPYGGSVGTAVTINANGTYFLQGGNNGGGLDVTVAAANLPTSTTSASVTIANRTEKFFLSQTKAESDAGVTKYHCFAIKNTHASLTITGIKLWISENTPGADNIALYLDPIAASNGATGPTAVANENTAPSGATWVVPDSLTHTDALSVGTLTSGQCRFFWIRQVTPAGVDTITTANTFKIGIYMRG